MREYDLICCGDIRVVLDFMDAAEMKHGSCIISHPDFKSQVLKCHSLLMNRNGKGPSQKSMKSFRKEFRKFTDMKKTEKCREAFLKWIYGKQNLQNTMVVPACVVLEIREKWTPSAGELYFEPFRTKKICRIGTHCRHARLPY